MSSRLRECKRKYKGLGGRGKLTSKMIDKLTVYYGLVICRHCDSIEDMKNAIWATYYHYNSTNENPQHQYYPATTESTTTSCENPQHQYYPATIVSVAARLRTVTR